MSQIDSYRLLVCTSGWSIAAPLKQVSADVSEVIADHAEALRFWQSPLDLTLSDAVSDGAIWR
jgi:hypothetical protein